MYLWYCSQIGALGTSFGVGQKVTRQEQVLESWWRA
jgi:hypothetical protein